MRTALYRHFASDETLLYVGISLSWAARTKAHSRSASWFDKIARVSIEWFDTREEALEAERAAIKAERPKFNVVHNRADANLGSRRIGVAALGTNAAVDDVALRFSSSQQRKRARSKKDPIFRTIKGPHVIVGPALIYQKNQISVMIAHGVVGSPGHLTEVVIGEHWGELPGYSDLFVGVLVLKKANQMTMAEAQEKRADLVRRLRAGLQSVELYDTDLALAVAYATNFPSAKSRKLLNDVSSEFRAKCA